jgi:mono/diheme cytochrome c family protein
MVTQNADNKMFGGVKKSMNKNEDAKIYGLKLAEFSPSERKLILAGGEIYKSLCVACHGPNGKGLPTNAAPPLRGAKRIDGDKATAIRILLHGLDGPIDGKKYPSVMAAMDDNSDEWVASIVSYVRYEFVGPIIKIGKGKEAIKQSAVVLPADVKKLREEHASRKDYWTIEELEKISSDMK